MGEEFGGALREIFPNLGFLGEEVFALVEDPAFGIQFDGPGAAVDEDGDDLAFVELRIEFLGAREEGVEEDGTAGVVSVGLSSHVGPAAVTGFRAGIGAELTIVRDDVVGSRKGCRNAFS